MKKIPLEYNQSSKTKKKILILGKNSTLSKELYTLIKKDNFDIERTTKKEINFKSDNYRTKLKKKILSFNPDIIINFIGKFNLNEKATKDLLILNTLPTWEILKIFLHKKIKKKTNLLIIGSSSFDSPRKKYMLYAASKSALNSLIGSAIEYFSDTKMSIKIFNPSTFGGKHIDGFNKKINIDANKVAKDIYRYIKKQIKLNLLK
tara:strand:- start:8638 stop:9252 length:615 start_codon:yes stop_codon:yes gene_type:complete